jgi:hypothetical protein
MTIEDKLKSYILARYRSVREFAIESDIPQSTIASIFSRGLDGAKVGSIIKICKALNISMDALADGEIVPKTDVVPIKREVKNILTDTKIALTRTNHLTIDGKEVDQDSIDSMIEALDIGYEMTKRKNER